MRFRGFDDCVEADVVEQLVTRLMMTGCWHVYTELSGRRFDGAPGDGRPRVDVLAVPNGRLISQPYQWSEGVLAFECKRPGTAVSKAVDQVVGYKNVAWSLPGGVEVVARSWWLWPMAPSAQVGDRLMRIRMNTHGIGLARVGEGTRLYQLGNVMGGSPLLTASRRVNDVSVVYNPSATHRPGVSHGWRFNQSR